MELENIITPPPVTHYNVLLASNSPRRRELLRMILPSFSIAEAREVDESYPATLPAEQVPVFISQTKAKAYSDLLIDNEIVLTADTVVICDNDILGKPADHAQACEMLQRLSGREHCVTTGVTLTSNQKSASFAETTLVRFDTLTPKEIEDYVTICRPFDKAGAYGIQEWIGCIGISGITGCFYNVMGLPLHTLYRNLCDF